MQVGHTTIYTGDVFDVLRTLPPASVHCVVTSPPYFGLRDYKIDGQIGMEETPQKHIELLVCLFREVRRVLRNDGTLWVNYGDAYASSANGRSAADTKAAGNDDRTFRDKPISTVGNGFKPKDLMMLPARLAIALQEDGWYLRSEIVWCKRSPMPESVSDRPSSAHEKIYLLTKQERYFYDAEAVRERAATADTSPPRGSAGVMGSPNGGRRVSKDGTVLPDGARIRHGLGASTLDLAEQPATRNQWNYWLLASNSRDCADAHFATFPPEIPRRCIMAGTSERGVCPQCGCQWRRIVAKGEFVRTGGGANTNKIGDAMAKSCVQTSIKTTPGRFKTQTTGWEPSCHCNAGEPILATVLDPFGGAMTTPMVANQLGRKAIAIELNPEYVAIGVKRLQHNAAQELLPMAYDAPETPQPAQAQQAAGSLFAESE